MPVATVEKVKALAVDLGTQKRLAEVLGVDRSRVTRWLRGEGIDDANAERIDQLELVMSLAFRNMEPEAVESWLFGINPFLGDRQPIFMLRLGRYAEVLGALQQQRAFSYA